MEGVVGRRQIAGLVLGRGLWDMVVEVSAVAAQVGLVGIGMGGGAQSGLTRRKTFWLLLCLIQSSVRTIRSSCLDGPFHSLGISCPSLAWMALF